MKKILFITGTRADYGKIKSLMQEILIDDNFKLHIFVTGMHMLSAYGATYHEIEKDGFVNIYKFINQTHSTTMDIILSNTMQGISNYVNENKVDLIVVHGDRVEALAGAIVGALNNIRVAHIEGGEVSGTIDESIRHAISKFSHIHFVANIEAKNRLIQLGERSNNIYVIGSPDIDIMMSNKLPSIIKAKHKYSIDFDDYAIVMFHPVTTDVLNIEGYANNLINSLIKSKKNYIVIYPNNDLGSKVILKSYKRLEDNENFKLFPSLKFEYFLTLLKHSEFLIGNSSAGIRETEIYGIPSINIGDRQQGRYKKSNFIIDVDYSETQIFDAILSLKKTDYRPSFMFGEGNSSKKFLDVLKNKNIFNCDLQKKFHDIE